MIRREYHVITPITPTAKAKLDRWIKGELTNGRKVVQYGSGNILKVVSVPHTATCPDCDFASEDMPFGYPCEHCGSTPTTTPQ